MKQNDFYEVNGCTDFIPVMNPNSAGGKLVLFKQQGTGRLILVTESYDINHSVYYSLEGMVSE